MFGNRKPKNDDIRKALNTIDGITIDNLLIDRGKVRAVLSIKNGDPVTIEMAAEQALKSIPSVKEAQVIITAEKTSDATIKNKSANTEKIKIDAKKIIAVASGKGGVGKSTVAMNIAAGLASSGQKIGLLDADIYGPSVPRMTGLSGKKPDQNANGKIIPLQKIIPSSLQNHSHPELDSGSLKTGDTMLKQVQHDENCVIHVMSIGFMIGEDNPLIWRGPMVQSAFTQMLQDVAWEELDTLIIDLPPGTGDVQLTMAQRVPITGAIIVSTPQDIALIDARKGIEMFEKVGVPIIGLIENMSHYCCPQCGHQDDVFGHGGAKDAAEELGIPFLGDIPLNAKIRHAADQGEPVQGFYEDIIKQV